MHRDDAAKVYQLSVENGAPGSVFHAVAEDGVPLHDIAGGIGKALGIPTVSIPAKEAEGQFAALADNTATGSSSTVVDDIPVIVDFMKTQSG